MEATAETWTSKEVEAAELLAYINSLPRLQTTNLTITVRGGTIAGNLEVRGFYGTGSLTIQVAEGAEVVCQGYISVKNCDLYVELRGLKLHPAGQDGIGAGTSVVTARNCTVIWPKAVNSNTGAFVHNGGVLTLDGCELRGCTYALNAQRCGIISAHNCTGSDNIYGTMVSVGGIVLRSGTTPELMGGSANIKGGGIIVKSDGTLL